MKKQLINRTISILYRYNQRFFAQELEKHSLPVEVGQLPALIQIYRHPGITQDEISSNAGVDKGTVARTVKKLEDKRIILRQRDPKDRRVNHIFATQKGLEIKEEVFKLIIKLHEILYQDFCDSEIEEAISILERMRDNMKNHLIKQKID